jgi:putative effector of murein hydrolase
MAPLFWAAATLGAYLAALAVHRRRGRWWSSPLLLTWALCFGLALALHTDYRTYLRGTHWLLALLGPATAAFALPIHQNRRLIRRAWPVLAAGTLAGTAIALATSWLLAGALGLPAQARVSLLPRSFTTPFALAFAQTVGGAPELTAACVVFTGLFGASMGQLMLEWLPVRSAFARGALFGMGAHAVGTAKARDLGELEGSVAGLVMILAGVTSMLAAPVLAIWLR